VKDTEEGAKMMPGKKWSKATDLGKMKEQAKLRRRGAAGYLFWKGD